MSALAAFIGEMDPEVVLRVVVAVTVVLGAVPLFWPRKQRRWWVWLLAVPVWILAAVVLSVVLLILTSIRSN